MSDLARSKDGDISCAGMCTWKRRIDWNDERTALLTKLWAAGASASVIASRLGDDVSRNAVIGKVHRLGLPGRHTTSRRPKPRLSQSCGGAVPRPAPLGSNQPVRSIHGLAPQPGALPASALRIVRCSDEQPEAAPGVSLFDLKESMCRWPEGDPKDDDFHFCGKHAEDGQSYCDLHRRLAVMTDNKSQRRRIDRG
jgi:GcrA cell cycle regulator